MTTPTAAGWYDDPDVPEQLRYFDGVVWTAHTTPRKSVTAASSTIGRSIDVPVGTDRGAWQHPSQAGPGAAGPPPQGWASPPPGAWQQPGVLRHDGDVLAPWWRRLLARVVDSFVTSLLAALLSLPFLGPVLDAFDALVADAVNGGTPDQTAFQDALVQAIVPITVISLIVGLVYETAFLVWRSATPGKMLLGTVVRPVKAPGPISAAVALRRQAIAITTALLGLNAVLSFLGLVLSVLDPAWLLWDPKRQALHDKVADTVVVLKR
ncbi:RDD family protein [Nostocoides sp. Soil756]|jgi:uncharacterized RDD family membrane protein YckC|uniref:RDD family protein n=1 Tax=Nostocoides sp. Soil756 TaxID=1736399 RepID=UPI0006F5DF31|nr:RDD family protein [Tetrasphaera sp. Soil756]KRE62360.1 hypothetical protein ASG78_04775 [Tetrasphaera sp. Soil756]